MENYEKVIKGLECCAKYADSMEDFPSACDDCPYNDDSDIGSCSSLAPLLTDAIEMLREMIDEEDDGK